MKIPGPDHPITIEPNGNRRPMSGYALILLPTQERPGGAKPTYRHIE
jgi:hypothetical protein